MNRFKILNNATTLINKDFIIDPWIYGNLYNNSWSPFPDTNYDKKELSKIKFCYISHLHQDHWDLDTIKYFNKKTIFYISNMKFNIVIEKTLNLYGFKNIVPLEYEKKYNISKNYEISVVPPLNRFAHETDFIEDKDDNAVAIDTGILLKTKSDGLNHLILSDNSPYDYDVFKKYFKKKKITTFFFPYNGFADDYPLCYDNLKINQKKKLSLNRSLTREKYLIKFINKIKPHYIIPHSSEFTLNTKNRKEFDKIHPKVFKDKDLYSKRIEKITKIKSFGIYKEDSLYIDKDGYNFISKSNKSTKNKIRKGIKLKFPASNKKLNFEKLLKVSLDNYLYRIYKYKLNLREIYKWKLAIEITDRRKTYLINFKNKKIIKQDSNSLKGKFLMLKTTNNIIKCILEKKLHMNNCQIGCYLSWIRSPNIFSKDLNDSLNFLHI